MATPVTAHGRYYVQCPASATTVLQQVTGVLGNEIDGIWLDAGAGNMQLLDGGTLVRAWAAGTAASFIPLNWKSRNGAWSITLPAGLTATAWGGFS